MFCGQSVCVWLCAGHTSKPCKTCLNRSRCCLGWETCVGPKKSWIRWMNSGKYDQSMHGNDVTLCQMVTKISKQQTESRSSTKRSFLEQMKAKAVTYLAYWGKCCCSSSVILSAGSASANGSEFGCRNGSRISGRPGTITTTICACIDYVTAQSLPQITSISCR